MKTIKKPKTLHLEEKLVSPKLMSKTSAANLFYNRDQSWLLFNRRVLDEARLERHPLLERLRFISIYLSNLDEFVMKRLGALKHLMSTGQNLMSIDGLTLSEQVHKIQVMFKEDIPLLSQTFHDLKKLLAKESLFFVSFNELSGEEKDYLGRYFNERVFPLLTPLSVDPGHPFPFISNLSTSLAVVLGHPKRDTDEPLFSRIKIPEFINGYISLPDFSCTGVHRFISTIDLIQAKIEWLFPGMIIMASTPFRLTRNAELFHDVLEMDDLMEHMSSVLKEQKFASVVRLEHLQGADPWTIQFIKRELNLISADVVELMDALHFSSLTIICDLSLKKLRFSKWIPVIPEVFKSKLSIFDVLKKQDILVHHPYESFKHSVEYFLKVCAADPKVKSIKMTLYRTGDHSPFINALIGAAESGKQVVCLVELKARFDEKRNMRWAHALEDVGIHVVYGIMGLKTHSKLCLVVREEEFGEYKTYAHVGTGNYHSQTANIYTDLGLFTSDERVTSEVMEVFNYLTGRSLKDDYKHLLVAPLTMKKQFLELISREKNNALEGKPAQIIAKMNSLEDDEITRALYSASQAGVIVTMYVRGFCCLKPQIKGLSENIRVYSLLGRFLEHSRFFIFQAGAESLLKGSFYMGSADWMYRNMHARVEVITPIYDLKAKEKILDLCKVMEADMESKWELDARGVYIKPALKKDEASSTQVVLMQRTLQK